MKKNNVFIFTQGKDVTVIPTEIKKIKNIRMTAHAIPRPSLQQKDMKLYFRVFMKGEDESENSFYSPFFAQEDIISMSNDCCDKNNSAVTIYKELPKTQCCEIYLTYDFRFASMEKDYCMDEDFLSTKEMLEKALYGTDLYIGFMISHFNQIACYAPVLYKPEHYHVLLFKEREMNIETKDIELFFKQLATNEWIDCI